MPPSERPARFTILSLDGIRAYAFGMVFYAHGWHGPLGMFGVGVFFFLSGYLITTLMVRESKSTGTFSLTRFYVRRLLRIFPPLYLTVLFVGALALCGLLDAPPDHGSYFSAFAFYVNYWLAAGRFNAVGLGSLWSLAVEEHFYLLFPFLVVLFIKRRATVRTQAWVLGGLSAAFLAWRLVLKLCLTHVSAPHMLYGSDTRMDSILLGGLMALVANPALDKTVRPRPLWTIGGVLLLAASFAVRNETYRTTLHYTVQGIAFFPIYIYLIRSEGIVFWLFNNRVIRYLGGLSYTMYLVHTSLIYVAEHHIRPHLPAEAAALAGTILFSAAMHHFIERPLARVRKRLDAPSPAVGSADLAFETGLPVPPDGPNALDAALHGARNAR